MKLRDLDYKTEFYWKGERYKQWIRPKNPSSKLFIVVCNKVRGRYTSYKLHDIASNSEVKPVLRPSDIKVIKSDEVQTKEAIVS